MKKLLLIIFTLSITFGTSSLYAWKFDTHKTSVIKAFEFMESENASVAQKWIGDYIKYNGGSDIADKMGDKNGNTDHFEDTAFGSWWTGYRSHFMVFGNHITFTAMSHFTTMFRDGEANNTYDGYSYKHSLDDGFWGLNGVMKTAMGSFKMKNDGNAGNGISNPENGQGILQAYKFKYQESGNQKYYSTTDNYKKKYKYVVFEPASNAAAYWYSKTLAGQTPDSIDSRHIEYIGHVMHYLNDSNVAQHVWNTLDHNHSSTETWIDDRIDSMCQDDQVATIIGEFKDALDITHDSQLRDITIQEINTYFGQMALADPSTLYSKSDAVRLAFGKKAFTKTVAVNVVLMEKYIWDLYVTDESLRKF